MGKHLTMILFCISVIEEEGKETAAEGMEISTRSKGNIPDEFFNYVKEVIFSLAFV